MNNYTNQTSQTESFSRANEKPVNLRKVHPRVSTKMYIEIINAAYNEAAAMVPEMAMEFLWYVIQYLTSNKNYPRGCERVYKPFRRYRELIDLAAARSEKAREAARRRRERREAQLESLRAMSCEPDLSARSPEPSEKPATNVSYKIQDATYWLRR